MRRRNFLALSNGWFALVEGACRFSRVGRVLTLSSWPTPARWSKTSNSALPASPHTRCPKGCVFWCCHTGSVPRPGRLHSVTSWPIPSTAPKTYHHPDHCSWTQLHQAFGCQAPRLLTNPCNSETRPSGLYTWKTLSHWQKILCQHLFFLLELNIYNYFIYLSGVISVHDQKFPQ